MREIRPSGLEGGVAHCAIPTPIGGSGNRFPFSLLNEGFGIYRSQQRKQRIFVTFVGFCSRGRNRVAFEAGLVAGTLGGSPSRNLGLWAGIALGFSEVWYHPIRVCHFIDRLLYSANVTCSGTERATV